MILVIWSFVKCCCPRGLHHNCMRWKSNMTKQEFLRLVHRFPVAAAVKSNDDMQVALESDALLLFILKGDAFQIAPFVAQAHQKGKGMVVHVDLISGIGKDRAGIRSEERRVGKECRSRWS